MKGVKKKDFHKLSPETLKGWNWAAACSRAGCRKRISLTDFGISRGAKEKFKGGDTGPGMFTEGNNRRECKLGKRISKDDNHQKKMTRKANTQLKECITIQKVETGFRK